MDVIAEIGLNHDGSMQQAITMAKVANACGADIVKFQYVNIDELSNARKTNLSLLSNYEFNISQFNGILHGLTYPEVKVMFSYFTAHSLDVGKNCFKYTLSKAPADFITRDMKELKRTKVDYISFRENQVDAIIKNYSEFKGTPICLYTVSKYPASELEYKLDIFKKLKENNIPFGVSDHTTTLEVAKEAKELGALAIEKHFTLDRNQKGVDHFMSIEPKELVELVKLVKDN